MPESRGSSGCFRRPAARPSERSDAAAFAGADDGRRGLLWVGWFGFNAGSALGANGLAATAIVNTFAAPAGGVLAWMGIERFVSGKPSMLGGASGAVAGLVAVTPAAGTQRTDRRHAARRGGEPRLLRLRRIAQEPAALRRQPRRVRDPWHWAGSSGRSARRSSPCRCSAGMAATIMRWRAQLGVQLRRAGCHNLVGRGLRRLLCAGPAGAPATPRSRCRARRARHRRSWGTGV